MEDKVNIVDGNYVEYTNKERKWPKTTCFKKRLIIEKQERGTKSKNKKNILLLWEV